MKAQEKILENILIIRIKQRISTSHVLQKNTLNTKIQLSAENAQNTKKR